MKILLLTASYGTGHITATKSIYEVIKQHEPNWEVKIIDFLYLKENVEYNKLTFFQKLYNFSMERPHVFDTFFFLTNNKLCTTLLKYMILLSSYKKVKQLFDTYLPDILISAHPYWNFVVKKYKKEVKNIPYICIVTDSVMIHRAWIDKSVDYYCVIDEDTKHVLINNGIHNIFVTGFPVSSKLFEKFDKKKILAELGLKEDKLTILVTVGLGAVERFLQIIDFLRVKKNDFQLIIVTGKYQWIYNLLKQKKFYPQTVLIGWTDRMFDFIRVSDLVICKGGGAIVSETLSGKTPVFVPVFVPAQERGNVYIIKKYKLGFYEEDINQVFYFLENIVEKKIDLAQYKENIVKFIHENPAKRIFELTKKILLSKV